MDELDRMILVKNVIRELSKSNKKITVDQIKEASGIQNPEKEITILKKRGIIMKLEDEDVRWV